MRQNWPERLWLVRHGQSQGNVARDAADEAGAHVIDLDVRDVDVPLSRARHATRPRPPAAGSPPCRATNGPKSSSSSPYVRARQTAEAICKRARSPAGRRATIIDERLREREFGVFDGLTTLGIRDKYPEEAAHRAKMGKFYHRPPGGESWADVILRLRSRSTPSICTMATSACSSSATRSSCCACATSSKSSTRQQILAIDKQAEILNCGIAAYDFEPDAQGLCVPDAGAVEPRRAAGGRGRAEDRRAGRDDRHAMKPPSRSTAPRSTRTRCRRSPAATRTSKGRILIVAGSREVPGAALLAATAAMRAGAGKLQIATSKASPPQLGVPCPRRWSSALPKDATAASRTRRSRRSASMRRRRMRSSPDPGWRTARPCAACRRAAAEPAPPLALDAALLHVLPKPRGAEPAQRLPILLPHAGELAALLDCDEDEVERDPLGCGRARAERYRALVLVKGVTSHVVTPDGAGLDL